MKGHRTWERCTCAWQSPEQQTIRFLLAGELTSLQLQHLSRLVSQALRCWNPCKSPRKEGNFTLESVCLPSGHPWRGNPANECPCLLLKVNASDRDIHRYKGTQRKSLFPTADKAGCMYMGECPFLSFIPPHFPCEPELK